MGTGEIGIPTLSALCDSPKHEVIAVVTQPDRPAGRSLTLRPPGTKKLALERGIPVIQPEKLRRDLEGILALEQPDLIVVMAYGQILPLPILQLPKVACLNLHASLLPKHRGASPIYAALREGDKETGITVMYMTEGLDCGDILLKESLSIAPQETAGLLHDRLAQIAPNALLKALELLEQGKAPRLPQDDSLATYTPKLTKEDAHLRWEETAEILDRLIRAMTPWPGAFCWWKEESINTSPLRLRILEAQPRAMAYNGARAGEILSIEEEGCGKIEVQCAQGSCLSLLQVQLEGRKTMSAAEFARGYSIRRGAILG